MSIIGWIVLGLIAGFIASKIVGGEGLGGPGVTGVNIGSIIVSVIGAIIVLWVYNAVASRA